MIAMVLCAGEGTRLRPLTNALPKPMVLVANRPVLEYTLLNLKKHGIKEVVINLNYRPEIIRAYFKDGSQMGIKIHYSLEKSLLGTAGGVKNAEKFFLSNQDTNILVTSGDSLTDFNFTSFIEFHQKQKTFCSIAIKEVESRFEYGVTLINKNNKIEKFIEKPLWGDVFSNKVNSGIYLFSKELFKLIPEGKIYDFGSDLLPDLMQKKIPIYGFSIKEFWTDVGNITEYQRAQNAVLDGIVSIPPKAQETKPGIWVGKGAKIHPSAILNKPCLIGNDCIIGKNAIIGAYTVIANNSKIGSNSTVNRSVLWNGTELLENVNMENCIVGSNEIVPEKLNISNGIILKGGKVA